MYMCICMCLLWERARWCGRDSKNLSLLLSSLSTSKLSKIYIFKFNLLIDPSDQKLEKKREREMIFLLKFVSIKDWPEG